MLAVEKALRTFFDILEEVIEKRENNSRDVVKSKFKTQKLKPAKAMTNDR